MRERIRGSLFLGPWEIFTFKSLTEQKRINLKLEKS